jgi:site-specific DNA-methyltransferase (adenine-specific)
MNTKIIHGESLETLKGFATNSIDSIVTDPPYEIGFIGNSWDSTGIAYNVEFWQECLRVLKPGGHLLSFGATRTWHRVAVAIEDAGFEVRDSFAWMYGTGMPKSNDIAKSIDKMDGDPDKEYKFTEWMRSTGLTAKQINEATGTNMASHYLTAKTQPQIPTPELFEKIRPLLSHVDIPEWVESYVAQRGVESDNYKRRKTIGSKSVPNGIFYGETYTGQKKKMVDYNITEAATPEAKKWEGWGTALKPAFEPIVVARKPLESGTVARNVLKWGTGAINVNESRIGARWPSNVIVDEPMAEEVDAFSNEAARFFYVAKPSSKERIKVDGLSHPTVKPLALMRYLIKLVTPPGGVVLDPFAGSGTTVEAAVLESFDAIGIEMTEEYIPLIEARVARSSV